MHLLVIFLIKIVDVWKPHFLLICAEFISPASAQGYLLITRGSTLTAVEIRETFAYNSSFWYFSSKFDPHFPDTSQKT